MSNNILYLWRLVWYPWYPIVSVSLLVGPEAAVITGPDFAEVGSTALFNCSANSYPPSGFTWWFNSSKVANTSMFRTASLSFSMSGEYTCVASNDVTGENSSTTKMLTVVGKRLMLTPLLQRNPVEKPWLMECVCVCVRRGYRVGDHKQQHSHPERKLHPYLCGQQILWTDLLAKRQHTPQHLRNKSNNVLPRWKQHAALHTGVIIWWRGVQVCGHQSRWRTSKSPVRPSGELWALHWRVCHYKMFKVHIALYYMI